MEKPKLFFGTNNPHKLREIKEILGSKYHIVSFKDLDHSFDVEETEDTLEGNAALKAKAFYEHTGWACFSDDSGLEVDALEGRPGVYTARYAGKGCTSDDNIDKLLRELADTSNRGAQFRTVIAYYDGTAVRYFEGKIEGEILHERTGSDGFGYDPVFLPHGHELSFAQMQPDDKNAISHRGKAVRAFAKFLMD